MEFRQVRYSYEGSREEALRGVDFKIGHGEKVALLGPNGAGKSTLLLHTDGLLLPASGEVVVCGMPVERKTLADVRRRVGMVFQNPDDQLFMPTVEEDVAFGPLNMGLDAGEVEMRISAAMRAVGAEGLRKRSPMQLSGGQKRAVALAAVLAMRPQILVLDEPTANLDGRTRRSLMSVLGRIDSTCIIATHDLAMARALCTRAIVMDEGRVVADGSCAEVIADPVVADLLGAVGIKC
ncbi:MAG: ABC transporter ATP-binding protein [Muribaculaceae bacterium]|nr:ABC transporter ATP-binding protein [Muribaculaceae bacterium]MCI9117763.1 ABC transporter ATP-binding protein [Muribaculaceae bacterium]